ncbi:MAG: EamA family transporter [Patescibacteria group bacterium]|jgi:drug/metabolite transporter (DMT)-like permease
MLYPFLAVIFDVLTLISTKRIFVKFKNLDYKSFAWWLFFWIAGVGLLVSPWFVTIQSTATQPHYLWLLLALVFLAANYNLLFYFGLKYEKVSEIEPFLLFNPLIAIVIASLFFPGERSWHVYLAAAVAGLALAWSHLDRQHLKLSRPLLAILGFALLHGLEAVIIKELLMVYSPLALYLVRCITTALFLWVIEKGKIKKITLQQVPFFLLIAVGALVTSVLIYTSYHGIGISMTMAVLLLSPILVYLLSVLYLREKLQWKNIVSSVVIIGAIIWLSVVR